MKKIIYLFSFFLLIFIINTTLLAAPGDNSPKNTTYSTSRTNPKKFAEENGYGLKTKGLLFGKVYTKYTADQLREKMADYYKAHELGDEKEAARLKKEIKDNSREAYEFFKVKFDLGNLVKELQITFEYIPYKLTKLAIYLLGICTSLEIVDYLLSNPGQFPFGSITKILIKYACLRYLIGHWYDLMFYIDTWMKTIATTALAGQVDRIPFSPDTTWEYFTQPLRDSISDLSWYEPILKLFYLIGSLPAYILAGLLTLDLFMAKLEAILIIGFAIIIVPLAAWQKTGVGTVVSVIKTQFSKLMIMYFFLGLWRTINPSIAPFSFSMMEDYGLILLGKYTLILFATRMLIGKSIAIAGAILGGGSGMFSSNDITRPLSSLTAKAIGLGSVAIGALGLAKSSQVAKTLKGMSGIGKSKADRMSSAADNKGKED